MHWAVDNAVPHVKCRYEDPKGNGDRSEEHGGDSFIQPSSILISHRKLHVQLPFFELEGTQYCPVMSPTRIS